MGRTSMPSASGSVNISATFTLVGLVWQPVTYKSVYFKRTWRQSGGGTASSMSCEPGALGIGGAAGTARLAPDERMSSSSMSWKSMLSAIHAKPLRRAPIAIPVFMGPHPSHC